VVEVNEALPSTPELVNKSPFDQAWMIKVEMQDPGELSSLMNSDSYQAYCAERSN
jgi:glycine cleavage system H protein